MTTAQTKPARRLASGQQYQALDLLATLVAVVDADGVVLWSNAALEDLLGTSRRAIAGLPLCDWFESPELLQNALASAGGNEYALIRYDDRIRRPGHELLHVHVLLSQMEESGRFLVELLPLEQQARMEREERLVEQAQANKELIRNLAHEIKNPLGGIRGAAQLLEHELSNPSLKEYTQVIIKEADRLQDLMQRLLTPHRAMLPTTVNIHEILERVRSLLTAEFPGSLSMRRDYDTSLPELVGDREQLIQAVLNIARNAAQAMNGEGEIVLRTRVLRQVTLAKKRYRLALEIKVIDNGPGIPETVRERMFYPLVSGRDGGSGLGLTIAQNFVQHHLGTIDCTSQPGHTIFTIRLPVEQA